jgi:hypothetical protein
MVRPHHQAPITHLDGRLRVNRCLVAFPTLARFQKSIEALPIISGEMLLRGEIIHLANLILHYNQVIRYRRGEGRHAVLVFPRSPCGNSCRSLALCCVHLYPPS